MSTEILAALASGATLTVRAHDVLNPSHGHFARIEYADGSTVTGAGVDATDAMEGLAQALSWPKRSLALRPALHQRP